MLPQAETGERQGGRPDRLRSSACARLRFAGSWIGALVLIGVALPRAVGVSWQGVLSVLRSVPGSVLAALALLWLLGLVVHSFVLTAAAPTLSHRRALTLNVTGSAVANVVPLGGAAGVELNRRMMRAWGIDARSFTGYTFLTNLWDVGSKLLLPLLGVIALVRAGEAVTPQLRTASLVAGLGFVGLVALAAVLLLSPRGAAAVGRTLESTLRAGLRLVGRDRELGLAEALLEVRRECAGLVAGGWLRMSVAICGYLALQYLLLVCCLQLTGGGSTWSEVLAGFAVERLLTVVPVTPGGVGVADLGLVGALLALGGDPVGVTAGAVLYRLFTFALEIPVGGGALGIWLLGRRLTATKDLTPVVRPGRPQRVAHVTDVFLPRVGGIETLVDDLVRHQRTRGLDAVVLTPSGSTPDDPEWVVRSSSAAARMIVRQYDVVHAHVSMWSPYAVGVARAAMAAGVPTLVTVHSMWTGAGILLRLGALAGLRRWPVVWSAVSGAAAETFRRSMGGIDVAVLPNAIDVSAWRRDADRPTVPESSGAVTVVSVMRLMPRKRPMELLRMFDRVRRLAPEHDVRLVIVGGGPLHRRMERCVRRRGLSDRVRITGQVPRQQVRDELRTASVYVAPAPKESFGIAALEARCAGLPVVAHRRSGVAEFVRDGVDGILVADDSEMVGALVDLVTDGRLRSGIAAHNRRITPVHDWSGALERTDALYGEAVVRASAAPQGSAPLTASLVAGG